MEADLSKLWVLSKEGEFGLIQLTTEMNDIRALWMRNIDYQDQADGTHGIVSEHSRRDLLSKFDGAVHIFQPQKDLMATFESGDLRAVRIKDSLGGGYIIVVPGQEFHKIGTSRLSPEWMEANQKTLDETIRDMGNRINFKTHTQLEQEAREYEINTDPKRRPDNLIIEDAVKVLTALQKTTIAGERSNDGYSYPPFIFSSNLVWGLLAVFVLFCVWFFSETGPVGTFFFLCAELMALGIAYFIWRFNQQIFNINENDIYDVHYLNKLGLVEGEGTGQTITRISGRINNLSNKKLRVKILPGTYFRSTGDHQNMVSTTEYQFDLNPKNGQLIEVDAACINASRPIPGEQDKFSGIGKVSQKVSRFLSKSINEDPMTIQAGVWACTDNLSGIEIKERLISTDALGHRTSAVSDDNIRRAREILGELGISTPL